MSSITIQSPIAVLTDGNRALVITDISFDLIKDNRIPALEDSILVKSLFQPLNKPLFCHVFPSADIISYELLEHTEGLVDKAIKYKPDSD